jgi:hypothetical protein
MKSQVLFGTTGGLFFLCINLLVAQPQDSVQIPENDSKKPPNQAEGSGSHKKAWLLKNARVTGGQITLPFKIRKSQENETFKLTTDVTLGGYIGYTRKIALEKDYYLTVPLTAGLTFINLNNNNTALAVEAAESDVVPGITWSTGLVFQLDQYSLGLMFGKDYASDVGNQWAYHGKLWWSFGIGFVFLQ